MKSLFGTTDQVRYRGDFITEGFRFKGVAYIREVDLGPPTRFIMRGHFGIEARSQVWRGLTVAKLSDIIISLFKSLTYLVCRPR